MGVGGGIDVVAVAALDPDRFRVQTRKRGEERANYFDKKAINSSFLS
jgi:hypothetical protein